MSRLKNIIFISTIVAGCLAFLNAANAGAVLQLLPREISLKEGEEFSVTVKAMPESGKNYTVKLSLKYSPEQLSFKSFSLSDRWISLDRPGYAKSDEQSGELVRTAGYPGGFSSAATFGTVTFVAAKTGVAELRVAANSMVLDDKGTNVIIAGQPVKVTAATSQSPQAKQPRISTGPSAKVGSIVAALTKSMPSLFDFSSGLINKKTRASLLSPLPIGVEMLIIVLIGYIIYIRRSEKLYDKSISRIRMQKPDGRIH